MQNSRLGQVAGPVGLMLLLASLLTLIVSGDVGMAAVNAFSGVLGVLVWLVSNLGKLGEVGRSRGTFFLITTAATTVLLTALAVALQVAAVRHPRRWDVTREQIHTLSEDTLRTLTGLQATVEVLAFVQPGDPTREPWNDLFRRYAAHSDRFTFRFIDPIKDPVAAKTFNIREGGARVVVKLDKLDQRLASPSEEELTNALVKVTHSVQKKVYFLTGHGEAELADKSARGLSLLAARMANEGLTTETLSLSARPEIPKDAEVLVVAGAEKRLSPVEEELLRNYSAQGGKLLLLTEPLEGEPPTALLSDWGISVDPGVVVDLSAQRLFKTSAFMPVVVSYPDHELTRGFRLRTAFPTAASLTAKPSSDVTVTPVLITQEQSWVESTPESEPIERSGNEKSGPLNLGVVGIKRTAQLDASVKRSDEGRIVVIGDRDFLQNGGIATEGNGDLALNALNWLAQQTERITIRPKSRAASRVYLTAVQMNGLRFFSTQVPIVLLAFGLSVHFLRRSR